MQTATYFHHHIFEPVFPQTYRVFDYSTAFHTPDYVFCHNSALCNQAIVRFLFGAEFATLRLLERACVHDTCQFIAQKAQIIDQFAALCQRVGRQISNRLVVNTPFEGITQKQDHQRADQQHILDCMALALAAVETALVGWVTGTVDWSFGAIVKKGVANASDESAVRRSFKSARLREGKSPRLASAAWSAGSSAWIHWLAFGWPMPKAAP